MRQKATVALLVTLLAVVTLSIIGCGFDRNHMLVPTAPVISVRDTMVIIDTVVVVIPPIPPSSGEPDTAWTGIATTCVTVDRDHSTKTIASGISIPSLSIWRTEAVIDYSDRSDQDLKFHIIGINGTNGSYYLRDSTGRDIVYQPNNYKGGRHVWLVAHNVPAGKYKVVVEYLGTIRLTFNPGAVPLSNVPVTVQWNADVCTERFEIGILPHR